MKKTLFIFTLLTVTFNLYSQTLESAAYPGLKLTNDNAQARFWGNGSEKWVIGSSGDATSNFLIYDAINSKARFLINETNGNVGIGISNPQEILHINGSIRGNGTSGSLRVKTASGYIDIGPKNASYAHIYTDRSKFIFNKDVFSQGGFSSYGTYNLSLKTNGIERLTIDNPSGNVGVGTSTPDEKLTVKGKIHAEEVRVNLDVPGPDYVFEKYFTNDSKLNPSYKMLTLEEVEAFTKTNNHLPEIPSSKEMQEDGIQLKEMNLKLLQKIEELTLYTIEQQKELKQQKENSEALAKRLENRIDNLEKMLLKTN